MIFSAGISTASGPWYPFLDIQTAKAWFLTNNSGKHQLFHNDFLADVIGMGFSFRTYFGGYNDINETTTNIGNIAKLLIGTRA
jgi:hypothetical protein